jgi:hypothetical protein
MVVAPRPARTAAICLGPEHDCRPPHRNIVTGGPGYPRQRLPLGSESLAGVSCVLGRGRYPYWPASPGARRPALESLLVLGAEQVDPSMACA